ncbi:hypothetical protein K492DRAFT_208248 [Lichtheimia hyalospora FSU 10163]|nr:hypothetical protein K492DRAFT_208248 [Lichtheimia hyalospora FSU 10163]
MESTAVLTNKEKQVLDSQREIEWLRRQIDQYQRALATEPSESDNHTEHDLCNTIDRLRAELDVMTQFNLSRKCLTRNLDASYHTLNTLFSGPSDHDSMERRRLVTERLQERDELTVLILRIVDQLKKARVQLTKTQAKVMDTHIINRQLVQAIQRVRNQRSEGIAREASQITVRPEVMDDMVNRLEIARNVLMGLMLESGIDWANDERWLQVMLKLGDQVEEA